MDEEIGRLRRAYDTKNNSASEEKQWKIRQLEDRLNEAVTNEKQTRMRTIEMLEKYDRAE